MNYCLPDLETKKFLSGLKSGEIDPAKLNEMSSAERHSFFEDYIGKAHARDVNALFESKLLLKNQQQGMINWAKKIGGLKADAARDAISRIEKMDKILSPSEQKNFLEDLASKRLGTDVTFEEAKKISDLSKDVVKAKEVGLKDNFQDRNSRIAYGEAQIKLLDYLDTLKPKSNSKLIGAMNIPRTLTTIGDWGWTFRQGWGMLSRPQLWQGLYKSFGYAFKNKSFQDLRADIISDPDFPLLKDKLRLPALTTKLEFKEEEFMNQFTGKLPVLKQVERAQTGLASFVRFAVAKKMLNDARLAGEDIVKGSKDVTDIINSVNNFSGSGNLGTGDKYANTAPLLNATLFSARKISSIINILDPRNYLNPNISMTARKANFRNLVGSMSISLGALYISSLFGAKVEKDSTSSNFGKIQIGSHHIDVTGGNATYATLLGRIIKNQTKSATTGKITEFGTGYKPETRGSTILNFGRNKLAPVASDVVDWFFGPVPSHDPQVAKELFGQPKKGTPFDLKREAVGNITPMMIDTVIQSVREDPSNMLLGNLLDFFGASDQIFK